MLIKAVFGGIAAIAIGIIVISLSGESVPQASEEIFTQSCSGTARCISGTITEVIDGDTIRVYTQSIRFALSSTPELSEPDGYEAKSYVESVCPVGSSVVVDEDDFQTEGSYGRIIGVIYCNGYNLNEAVLDSGYGEISTFFCDTSEFAGEAWAVKNGC